MNDLNEKIMPWRWSWLAALPMLAGSLACASDAMESAALVSSADCFGGVAAGDPIGPVPADVVSDLRGSVECEWIEYRANGLVVQGFIARPKDRGMGQFPAVIYNRGGNGALGRVTVPLMFMHILPLASRGFVVIGSQYRDADEFGGQEVADVLALFDLLDDRSDVSGERVGMMGHSRGGIETVIAASRSRRVAAIALLGTPSDLFEDLRARPDMQRVYRQRIPDYDVNPESALHSRSPLYLLDSLSPVVPVLILHGGNDQRARPLHAERLGARLEELRRTHKVVIYPDDDHMMSHHRAETVAELANWFGKYLGAPAHR